MAMVPTLMACAGKSLAASEMDLVNLSALKSYPENMLSHIVVNMTSKTFASFIKINGGINAIMDSWNSFDFQLVLLKLLSELDINKNTRVYRYHSQLGKYFENEYELMKIKLKTKSELQINVSSMGVNNNIPRLH